jgi:hypothetical protein
VKKYIVASRDVTTYHDQTFTIELWQEVINDLVRRRNQSEKALQKNKEE